MSSEDNVAAQERLAEKLNSGDIDAAVEAFADDAVDHDPAPDQGQGREGFRQFFGAQLTAFPDAQIKPEHMVVDDDNVAIAYTVTGTHDREFNGIAPTGRRVEFRGMQIGRFENGEIVERWGSSDELGLMQQLGASPADG